MRKEVLPFFICQLVILVFYGLFVYYGDEASSSISEENESVSKFYPFFQNVHVMIFIGFGFLMTFPRAYSHSALVFNFFVVAFTIQVSILVNAFFHQLFKNDWHTVELNIETLITADFAAGALLITFGALLGKTTWQQMMVLSLLMSLFYALNESIGVILYEAVDMGGSIFVHTFGAYFGIAAATVLNRQGGNAAKDRTENQVSYSSDTFAMIGTLFLWMFWPSFNGALASGNSQERVIVNTVLSLAASCVTACLASWAELGIFKMHLIQNATLAGGVAIGSAADLVIGPVFALTIGSLAGFVSVVGFHHLSEHFGIEDTCAVHNLHGIPGVMGGIAGFFAALFVGDSSYGDDIGVVYPARADGRSAKAQAAFQIAALFTTLGISMLGGTFSGWIISKLPSPPVYFVDAKHQ